jgi:Fic family protein
VQFTPPEHVQSELDEMLRINDGLADRHPVIRAAWLHYTFVAIHPFDDGNGRVARALAVLILLQGHYALLVVDRESRTDYLKALSQANGGDLRGLVRLFAGSEIVALRSELEPAGPRLPAAVSDFALALG